MPQPRPAGSGVLHLCPVFVLICLVIFLFPAPAFPDPGTQDRILMLKAGYKAGNAAAAYQLGSAYQYGRGVWKNQAEAVRWYQLGARRGDDKAALALADSYLAGEGTPQNEEKAIYWYVKLGAGAGVCARPARTRLLTLTRNYALGDNGMRQDPVRARDLFSLLLRMEQEGQARAVPAQMAATEP